MRKLRKPFQPSKTDLLSRFAQKAKASDRSELLKREWRCGLSTSGAVVWDSYERLDFYLTWEAPKNWRVHERTSENFINIQCAPPQRPQDEGKPINDLHGFTISSFAYVKKVPSPDPAKLLDSFMSRFSKSLQNSVRLRGYSGYQEAEKGDTSLTVLSSSITLDTRSNEMCFQIARECKSAVCEFDFNPIPKEPARVARGMCRAFYHPNNRLHYVALFAVPVEEYNPTIDLITQALFQVKGSVAAKRD
jgi:hypothetical protein